MSNGAKIFAGAAILGYIAYRLRLPKITILKVDKIAGSVSFTLSVAGTTFTDTVFLNDARTAVILQNGYVLITSPDLESSGVDLTIGSNYNPQDLSYKVEASEWIKVA